MPTLSLPSAAQWASATFGLSFNTLTSVSPLSRVAQTLEKGGPVWRFEGRLIPLTPAQVAVWDVFIAQMRGGAGRFALPVPGFTRAGSGAGTPLVDGASQTGATLNTKGWTLSAANVLRAGDYVSFATGTTQRLHRVVADVSADAAGLAAVSIEPPLRGSPSDDAAIETAAPFCVMRFESDDQLKGLRPGADGPWHDYGALKAVEAVI